jgi:ankyrin repeat protein
MSALFCNSTPAPGHAPSVGFRRCYELLFALGRNPQLRSQKDSVFNACLMNKEAISFEERDEIFRTLYGSQEKPGFKTTAEIFLQLPLTEAARMWESGAIDIDVCNALGRTVLMEVLTDFRASYEVIDFLVSKTKKLDARDFTGRTVLMHVVTQGVSPKLDIREVTKQLLDAGAAVRLVDNFGDSAIDLAGYNDLPEIVEMLSLKTRFR